MFGFLVAIGIGYVTPQIEAIVARPIADALRSYINIDASEMRLFGFMVAMLLAGIAAALFESGQAFWIILGGMIGYFGPRIIVILRSVIEGKK